MATLKNGTQQSKIGRPKGSKDKIPRCVKTSILNVYEGLGSEGAMLKWARENQTEFYKIYAKLLPKNVDANISGHLSLSLDETRERIKRLMVDLADD